VNPPFSLASALGFHNMKSKLLQRSLGTTFSGHREENPLNNCIAGVGTISSWNAVVNADFVFPFFGLNFF
jgi:hypothetical protein